MPYDVIVQHERVCGKPHPYILSLADEIQGYGLMSPWCGMNGTNAEARGTAQDERSITHTTFGNSRPLSNGQRNETSITTWIPGNGTCLQTDRARICNIQHEHCCPPQPLYYYQFLAKPYFLVVRMVNKCRFGERANR